MAPFSPSTVSVWRCGVGSLRSAGRFHSDRATGRRRVVSGCACCNERSLRRLWLSNALVSLPSVIQTPWTLFTRQLARARMERRTRGILGQKRQPRQLAMDRQIVDHCPATAARRQALGRGGSSSHVFHKVARHRALCAERCGSQDLDRQAAAHWGCTSRRRARDEQIYVV